MDEETTVKTTTKTTKTTKATRTFQLREGTRDAACIQVNLAFFESEQHNHRYCIKFQLSEKFLCLSLSLSARCLLTRRQAEAAASLWNANSE